MLGDEVGVSTERVAKRFGRMVVDSLSVFFCDRYTRNMLLSMTRSIGRTFNVGFEKCVRPEQKCFCCDSHLRAIAAGPASIIGDKSVASNNDRRRYLDIPAARKLPVVGTKLDFLMAGAGKKFVYNLFTYL